MAEPSSPSDDENGQAYVKHGRWTKEEDELLRLAIRQHGEKHWRLISENIPGRTPIQCLHRWSKILKPGLVKGPWSTNEDKLLKEWVDVEGPTKWSACAVRIPGRSGKQCRERWHNTLNPDVKKGEWTPEEDKVIFELQSSIGPKWTEIAKNLPGRTENSIKNRFYSTVRRMKINAIKNTTEAESAEPCPPPEVKPEEEESTTEKRMLTLVEQMKHLETMMLRTKSEISILGQTFTESDPKA